MGDGVVKNESAANIEFTLNAENQTTETSLSSPIDMNGATVEVVMSFDQAFVTDRSDGASGIFQFYAHNADWSKSNFICWTGYKTLVANQDITFTCSTFNLTAGAALGFQFFATTGIVTIKSATITLAP